MEILKFEGKEPAEMEHHEGRKREDAGWRMKGAGLSKNRLVSRGKDTLRPHPVSHLHFLNAPHAGPRHRHFHHQLVEALQLPSPPLLQVIQL